MVEEAMKYLETLEGQLKLDLIETLREVTEGKVRLLLARDRTAGPHESTVRQIS